MPHCQKPPKSVYQQDYPPFSLKDYPKCSISPKPIDDGIFNRRKDNLMVRNKENKESPPETYERIDVKEYEDFCDLLKDYKLQVNTLFFPCGQGVNTVIVEKLLQQLIQKTYEIEYKPDIYITECGALRCHRKPPRKYYESTYEFYHETIPELERFRDLLYLSLSEKNKTFLTRNKAKNKTPNSTYYNDICLAAIAAERSRKLKAKEIPIVKEKPLCY